MCWLLAFETLNIPPGFKQTALSPPSPATYMGTADFQQTGSYTRLRDTRDHSLIHSTSGPTVFGDPQQKDTP